MGAGEYGNRLEWLKKTAGTPDGFGQRTDPYPSQGYLWGAVEDLTGGRSTAKESERQTRTATVRLRNYPAVAAGDRLRSVEWGEVWTVEYVARGSNEVRCEVSNPAWSAGGGTAG